MELVEPSTKNNSFEFEGKIYSQDKREYGNGFTAPNFVNSLMEDFEQKTLALAEFKLKILVKV